MQKESLQRIFENTLKYKFLANIFFYLFTLLSHTSIFVKFIIVNFIECKVPLRLNPIIPYRVFRSNLEF